MMKNNTPQSDTIPSAGRQGGLGMPKGYIIFIEDGLGGKLDSIWTLRRLAEGRIAEIRKHGLDACMADLVFNEAPDLAKRYPALHEEQEYLLDNPGEEML
jgi:hypothetical protein